MGVIHSCKRPRLKLLDTRKYGLGVFADEKIKKGQVIYFLNGEPISLAECIRRVDTGREIVDDPLQIGLKLYLDLDDLSRTFNHSCAPNAGLRGRSELFAIKDIQKDEEITYDYSVTVGPNITPDMWTMACVCGADNCRKKIGNILSIPTHTLAKYKALGALQNYMKRLLDNIANNGCKSVKE